MLQRYFVITRQNSPVAAGECKVKHWTDLLYVGFFFASVECYSAQVDMAQRRKVSELNIQAQVQNCYQWSLVAFFSTVNLFYCAMSGWSSTLVPLIWSKVLILFGPKQHTVISSVTDGKRDYSKLDNTFTSRKVLHINSYYILNNTVFLDPCTIFYRQYVLGTLLYDMVKVSWGISQKGYIQLEDLLWAPACWDKDLCRTSQNTSMVSLWHLYGTIIYRGVSTMTHWTVQ